MIKRTVSIENPAYLSVRDKQLIIKRESAEDVSVPIEDLGFLILDNEQITVTKPALTSLLENNTSVILTDEKHMPSGMMMPLSGNTLQGERFRHQINSSMPLKKRLWQQIIKIKIKNQGRLLHSLGLKDIYLKRLIPKVKSDDSANMESIAAKYFWKHFITIPGFRRERFGDPPNNLLNYGYAILRAVIARSLIGSGLLPTIGIHHKNRYNAYPLADDIMEPYRPFVDDVVLQLSAVTKNENELTPEVKRELLSIPQIGVIMDGEKSPLLIAASKTSSSLYKCFSGESKHIAYPLL